MCCDQRVVVLVEALPSRVRVEARSTWSRGQRAEEGGGASDSELLLQRRRAVQRRAGTTGRQPDKRAIKARFAWIGHGALTETR